MTDKTVTVNGTINNISNIPVFLVKNEVILDYCILNSSNNYTHTFSDVVDGSDFKLKKYKEYNVSRSISDNVYTYTFSLCNLIIEVSFDIPTHEVEEEEFEGISGDSYSFSYEDLDDLTFTVYGRGNNYPITIPYSSFTNGQYTLSNIRKGTYSVVCSNTTSIENLQLTGGSNTGMVVSVSNTATVRLFLQYRVIPNEE